jgi:hypothetical protein
MRRVHPYRGENPEPGKDVHGELDPWPGIREQAGSIPEVTILDCDIRFASESGHRLTLL